MAEEEDDQMDMQTLTYLGKEWVEISVIIDWLNVVAENNPNHVDILHWVRKSLVKMKNYKQ